MPELNANIPNLRCFVRAEFLHDFPEVVPDPKYIPGTAHAVTCLENRALTFSVLLDNGAHIGRLPIHALVTKPDAPPVAPDDVWLLQLWDCFSSFCAVIEYDWLAELRCRVILPDKSVHGGTYLFTVDYYNSTTAESAGDSGWKCHHVIELDDGRIVAQPNNRICWFEPSAVTPFTTPPAYKTITRTWKCEDRTKWSAADSKQMFYSVEAIPADMQQLADIARGAK